MASTLGHWRDSAGSQVPTTSWAAMAFASQVVNDSGSNLTKPNTSTFQVGEALPAGKAKLFVASIKTDQTRNNRGTLQARFVVSNGASGNLWTTYATTFTRNSANRTGWVRVFGILTECDLNTQIQLEIRSGTDAITGGTTANASDVQIVDFHFSNIGMYTDTTGNQTLGGTTRTTVALNSTVQETDTDAIERIGNVVTMKGDNKKYVIFGSISGDAGGSRTQRNGVLAYDGTPDVATESYVYQRNSANEYAGMLLHDLYETGTANVTVEQQCYRGAGVGAGQGGADVDGSWNTTPGFCGLCVVELNGDAEGFRSHDSVGTQDIAGGVTTTLAAMRDVDIEDTASYQNVNTLITNSQIAHNMLAMSSIWAAREDVASGVRGTIGARITVGGVAQTVGEHGNYSRGNQGTQDTFGYGANPGGVYKTTGVQNIGVQTFDAGDNGADDTTQAGTVSFWALNLDTLEPVSSGVTGSGNVAQDDDSASASGDVQISGSASFAQGGQIIVASGDVLTSGSAAITQDDNTISSDGNVSITGTASLSQDSNTVSSSGVVGFTGITGSANITQDAQTLSSDGSVLTSGDLANTQDGDGISSSGGVLITGSASLAQEDNTVSSSGGLSISGSGSIIQGDDTASSTGSVSIDGQSSIVQDGDTLSSSGLIGFEGITGSGSISQDANTLSCEGSVIISGSLDNGQNNDTANGQGLVAIEGDTTISQEAHTASSSGTVTITGVSSQSQQENTIAGAGGVRIAGVGSLSNQSDTIVGEARLAISGAGSIMQEVEIISATGEVSTVEVVEINAFLSRQYAIDGHMAGVNQLHGRCSDVLQINGTMNKSFTLEGYIHD